MTTNPTLLQDKFIVWTQTELGYSVMAATIPNLRPFVKSLATNYGTNPATGYGSGSGSGIRNGTEGDVQSNTYQLSSLQPKGRGEEYKYRIWSARSGNRTGGESSTANRADAASVGSGDSQKMIIEKGLRWDVTVDLK